MLEYTIEDEFETTVDAYWEMFFSDAYNDALWPHIDVKYERLEFRDEDDGAIIHRRQRLTPNREIPRALKRLVSGAISYEEKNTFHRADSKMTVVVTPNFGANSLDSGGTYTVEPAGEGKVKRIWKGHVSCKIPMLGGSVEKTIADQVKDSYRRTTEFTHKWLAEQK